MNREKAQEILRAYGQPVIKNSDDEVIAHFARQTTSSIEEIEKLTNEELINRYKNLVWMNCIYGQVSLNDLQAIDLMDLEIDQRKISEGLQEWYDKAIVEFEINEGNA